METTDSRIRCPRSCPAALIAAFLLLLLPFPAPGADAQLSAWRVGTLPATPTDSAWARIEPVRVPLIPQDMVEPRQLEPTTTEVFVRSATDGSSIAFLLEWNDATGDDAVRPAQFTDACAIQLPGTAEADLPAPQMGEPGRRVEITYWRASWQASVEGRPETIAALYPGASVDHYPFEAPSLEGNPSARQAMEKRYAPARAAGNEMGAPRRRAVEDLIAEGPGTLSPALKQHSSGRGLRTANGWAVVLARPLPAALAAGKRTQIALAVWDGARGEVGARKMRSAWVPLAIEGMP